MMDSKGDVGISLQKIPWYVHLGYSILVLEDYTLTFTMDLARLFPEKKILNAIGDTKKQFVLNNTPAATNIYLIEKHHPNVTVKYDVDFKKTIRDKNLGDTIFTDIILNFIRPRNRCGVRKSQQHLRDIFNHVSKNLMREQVTRFHITFLKNHSGLNSSFLYRPVNFFHNELPIHEKDSYNVIYVAAESGLRVENVDIFRAENFTSYQYSLINHTIRPSDWEKIKEEAETFTFLKAYLSDNRTRLGSAKFMESSKMLYRGYSFQNIPKFLKIFHTLRPYHIQRISICFSRCHSDMNYVQNMLYGLIQEIAGPFIINIEENEKMRACCPQNNLPTRTYSIYWQGWHIPISYSMFNGFQDDLRHQLEKTFASFQCGLSLS